MFRHLTAVLNSILLASATTIGVSAQAQASTTAQTYYVDSFVFTVCGTSTNVCTVPFTKLPEKYILFNEISCYILSSQPLFNISFGVKATPTGYVLRKVHVPIPQYVYVSGFGGYTYTVNHPINILFGPGRYPVVTFSFASSSDSTVECTVTGEAVPGP